MFFCFGRKITQNFADIHSEKLNKSIDKPDKYRIESIKTLQLQTETLSLQIKKDSLVIILLLT